MSVMRRASPETMRALKAMRSELAVHAGRRGDRLEVKYLSGWVAFRSGNHRGFYPGSLSAKHIEPRIQ